MSQHDMDIANQGFPAFRSDLNNALKALASNSSGDAEPTTTFANQFWYETDTNLLKLRNEDNDAWITLAYFDQTNDEWEIRSAVIQAVDSAGLTLKTDDGTARITIADDGDVTIANDLEVSGSITVSDYVYHGGDSNTYFGFPAGDQFDLYTGAAKRMSITGSETVFNEPGSDKDFRVESDGNANMLFVDAGNNRVGIGTSSPSQLLSVAGNGMLQADQGYMYLSNVGTGNSGIYVRGTGSANELRCHSTGTFTWEVSGSEKMRMDSSGRLLINTTTSPASGAFATATSGGSAHIKMERTGSSGGACYIGCDSNDLFNVYSTSFSKKFRVDTLGNVQSATGSYGTISDSRLKENVTASDSQWDDIKAIEVVKYSLIEDDLDSPNQIGVIAQQLEEAGMSGLVTTEDIPEYNADETIEVKSVKYSILYMKAVKALQEAMERIETLETSVSDLQTRVAALEAN